MSLLGLLLFGSLATALGLVLAFAFARALLYTSFLDELDVARRQLARSAPPRREPPDGDAFRAAMPRPDRGPRRPALRMQA